MSQETKGLAVSELIQLSLTPIKELEEQIARLDNLPLLPYPGLPTVSEALKATHDILIEKRQMGDPVVGVIFLYGGPGEGKSYVGEKINPFFKLMELYGFEPLYISYSAHEGRLRKKGEIDPTKKMLTADDLKKVVTAVQNDFYEKMGEEKALIVIQMPLGAHEEGELKRFYGSVKDFVTGLDDEKKAKLVLCTIGVAGTLSLKLFSYFRWMIMQSESFEQAQKLSLGLFGIKLTEEKRNFIRQASGAPPSLMDIALSHTERDALALKHRTGSDAVERLKEGLDKYYDNPLKFLFDEANILAPILGLTPDTVKTSVRTKLNILNLLYHLLGFDEHSWTEELNIVNHGTVILDAPDPPFNHKNIHILTEFIKEMAKIMHEENQEIIKRLLKKYSLIVESQN